MENILGLQEETCVKKGKKNSFILEVSSMNPIGNVAENNASVSLPLTANKAN